MGATILMGVGGLLMLVGFVFWVILIINAFKTDTTQGILSLCIFPYAIYWGFAKFAHPKKGLIVGGMVACYLLGYASYFAAGMMAASALTDAYQQGAIPGAYPGVPGAVPGAVPGQPAWPTQ
jgi:hypothetical protein